VKRETVLKLGIAVGLAALTVVAYAGAMSNAFVDYDDVSYVTGNAEVLRGLTLHGVAWAFTTFDAANWHPITWLSHMLDVQMFGLDAGRHHLTSVLLHTTNGVLLFLLFARMTGALWRSALVAGLFAVHPLHVESVAWIAERKDVLSTMLLILTVHAWLGWLRSRTAGRYAAVVALFALGLMAKPMLVTLPLALMLLDVWPLNRTAEPVLWAEKLPLFALSAASAVVTFVAQRSVGAVQSIQSLAFRERLANAAESYVRYLGQMLWPLRLACFYPHPGEIRFPAALGSMLLLLGITVSAVRARRRAPYLSLGWFWYVVTLAPVIGLVQVGAQARADRYTYVPLIGIFVAMAWGLGELTSRFPSARSAVVTGCVVAILVLAELTRIQVGTWSGNASLYAHALAVTSRNWMAHNGLGGVYYADGRTGDAIAQFEAAIQIRPAYAKGHYNLAVALSRDGRFPEAIEHYQESVRLDPGFTSAYFNMGKALDEEGKTPEAIASYRKAIDADPSRADAWANVGADLHKMGDSRAALEAFQRSDQLRPRVAVTQYGIGLEHEALGQFSEARQAYEEAFGLDPNVNGLREALARSYRSLGKELEDRSQWSDARDAYLRVTRLAPDDAESWAYLAIAYQNEHDFDNAAHAYREAIRLNPELVVCRFNLGVLALKAGDARTASEQVQALKGLDAKLARTLEQLIK
jgi:tetratricopeptide (TPR) repeat protein